MEKVKISVLTLTYQRYKILEECIKSYLSQDYDGESEMVIINDSTDVEYVYDHPNIRIINCKERFPSIASKIEWGYKQCKYDYVYRLDDDDLLTPWALSLTSQFIVENPGYEIYRSKRQYFFTNNIFIQISDNINNGNVFTKDYLNRIVFPDKSGNEDVDIVYGNNAKIMTSTKEIYTMIYRWGMKTYHISGMGEQTNDGILNWTDKIVTGVQAGFNEMTQETGIITLNPFFENDYYSQIKICFESKIIKAILDKYNINGIEIGGTDKNTWHSYTSIYESVLIPYVNQKVKLLEIGVENGASSLLWQELLPLSQLYLVDVQDIIKTRDRLDSNRYKFYKMNAFSDDAVNILKSDNPDGFDIIIEDGPHTIESQIICIEKYLPLLRKNGILVMEDVQNISYIDILKSKVPSDYQSEYVDLRHVKNRYDDILFIVKN